MSVVYDILLQTGKVVSLLSIVLAFAVSGIILFKPTLAARLNTRANTWFSTQGAQDRLDTDVDTSEMFLRHRWTLGGLLLAGALFAMYYLLFAFDAARFIGLFVKPAGQTQRLLLEILTVTIKWFFVFCSALGVCVCSLLMLQPQTFRRLNEKLDRSISTKPIGDALDKTGYSPDVWVLKHHVAAGGFMFLASIYVLVLFISFLHR